ncbi:MAG: sugar transferase [Lentisphaeria bacterium]|nr:sugar transferase [Lentisphaeria bacterium]
MYNFFKRFFDLLLALTALLFTGWFLVPCMLILWCTGEHYIWYLQKRIGYKKEYFNIIKFATMLLASPSMGTGSLTTRNDPRVLPFGKFLRKTKINELPQIFNVFNGTMSLVGPRPQMEVDFLRFPKEVQDHIYDVMPGITGIGSVIFRDEEYYMSKPGVDPVAFYTEKIAPYKGEVELWYQKQKSLWVDFKIIFLTAWVILFPKSDLTFKWFRDLPAKPEWMEEK